MKVEPYLFFPGNCEDALAFYEATLGAARTMTMRYRESPDPLPPGMSPDGWGDKIMHASLQVGDVQLMASDGCGGPGAQQSFQGFQLALSVRDEAEAERVFTALSEGGRVTMPLGKTFFSPSFGMAVDRFGVSWAVIAQGEAPS
jgi:PhnB protein